MSAPALAAPGGRALTIRGTSYPVLLPTLRDARLHLAAVIITLQVLGQVAFEFRVSIAQILISLLVCAVLEVGIAVLAAARADVARERADHRERGRLRPARARDAARRLVEPERLVDLRRHRGRVAPLQARDPAAGTAHLQPVELRARPLLPDPRAGARRAARLLVGADGRVDGRRARRDRRRRTDHPRPPAPAPPRARLLADLRGRDRSPRCQRPRDDRPLARRPDHGRLLLVGARHLAGDPRLPLLHDHRPEDDPLDPADADPLRGLGRAARLHPDRARAHRVLEQGRGARLADGRLRRLAAAEALLAAADDHAHPDRARRRRRTRSVRRRARLRRDPRPQLRDRRTAHVHRPAAGDHDRHVAGRPEQAPRENRAPDRRRPGRRSRAPAARARAPGRQGTRTRGHFRSPARVATAAPGRTRPPHSRPRVPPRPDGRPLRGGQRPGRGDRRGDPGRHTSADDVLRDPRDRPAPCGADRLPRDARAPERRRPLAGRARPAPGRRERPLACRRPGSRRGLRRRPPHRCRAEGRPGLPPGRLPLRSHRGPAGDDGRRRLLARLRRRRLDGPLRRQLLRRGRHRRLRREPATQRPLSGTTTGSGSRRSTRRRPRAGRAASRPT